MLKTSLVLAFTLSLLTSFCTLTPWSWKMTLISFSRVPNPCKSLCEAKDVYQTSTGSHLNSASGPFSVSQGPQA